MISIQERIEWYKQHPKEMVISQSGKYQDFLQLAHEHFSKSLPNLESMGESFIEYWPILALINPHILIEQQEGYAHRRIDGESAIGYLLLTDKKIWISLCSKYSVKYSPNKVDGVGKRILRAWLTEADKSRTVYNLGTIRKDIFLNQELVGLQIGQLNHVYEIDSMELHICGQHLEIVEVLDNTLQEIYKLLNEAIRLANGSDDKKEDTLKSKLNELKELRDLGMITEDEYAQKRQKIIDQI